MFVVLSLFVMGIETRVIEDILENKMPRWLDKIDLSVGQKKYILDKGFASSSNKILQKMVLQSFLKNMPFSHKIDIEPSPAQPFKQDELIQRFRTILFELNKRYLKSSFPKWDFKNRFFIVGFAEGDGLTNEIHYHLLLHTPKEIYKKKMGNPIWDLIFKWIASPQISQIKQKKKKMILNKKDKFHIAAESFVERLPLQIEKIKSVISASVYASKWEHKIDNDRFFIIGLSE
jgi:hypothetical protein